MDERAVTLTSCLGGSTANTHHLGEPHARCGWAACCH